jgi:cytoskeletal protein RodZ
MAPDERDRNFDKALARHLRSAAPAGEAAPASEAAASRDAACADPETLAAYHERSLLSAEMNSWKEHIVGCANCQTILAQLEATDELPLQAFEKEEAVVKELEPVMAARNLEAFSKAAASSQYRRRVAKTAKAKKSRRVLLMGGARWQWLAPAGALAAGLLVWIALHENRPLSPPSLDHVQIATKQVPPPPPPVSNVAQEASPSPKAALSKSPSADDEVAAANTRGALDTMKSREKQDHLAEISPSPTLADKGRLRKDAENLSAADVSSAREQIDRDAKTVSGGRQENAEVQLQAQAANAQSQNQVNSNSPAIGGPAPLGQAVNGKKELKTARASAAPAPPAKPVAGYAGATSMMEVVTVSNPRLIAPPGSHLLWRAGRAGSIDFSSDGGASWSRQTSGVLVDLLTGSAPSNQVCWIVGRVGAILLTTDGGVHWKAVSSPFAEDLGGVRASDALHATVWNARATKSFQTSDGGLTWTPVPSP